MGAARCGSTCFPLPARAVPVCGKDGKYSYKCEASTTLACGGQCCFAPPGAIVTCKTVPKRRAVGNWWCKYYTWCNQNEGKANKRAKAAPKPATGNACGGWKCQAGLYKCGNSCQKVPCKP